MNCLVLGAGKMGIRHARGLLSVPEVTSVAVSDNSVNALAEASRLLEAEKGFEKCEFIDSESLYSSRKQFRFAIIATTADGRARTLERVLQLEPEAVLVEKPLGQNYEETLSIQHISEQSRARVYANLNLRLLPYFSELKHDFATVPQLQGTTNVTLNTGAIGIGANGIHVIDLLTHLFDAVEVEVRYANISQATIPSPRGQQFLDFGGEACLEFLKSDQSVRARALLAFHPLSSVFGRWCFVSQNGEVTVDELRQVRINRYRNPSSSLPLYRYGADYLPDEIATFATPDLASITASWLSSYLKGASNLPSVAECTLPHRVLFSWLSTQQQKFEAFPVT